ncbi:MAG: zinc ribbon domain-containing protein [Pseudomonadota bacterium]|nr:zinc ribbon domain-containing protein [Pseudomonadota bacterium]
MSSVGHLLQAVNAANTRLIRCGECGSQITAEHQKIYIYYHCTHRCSRYTCTQPYLRSERLDEQALALVAKAAENPTFHRYLTQLLETQDDMLLRERQTEHALLSAERDTLVRSGKTLLDLHLRGVVDEQTFGEEQDRLQRELSAVTNRLSAHNETKTMSALPQGDVVARFAAAAPETKHSVLRAVATDLVLYEKRLSFRLVPPPSD